MSTAKKVKVTPEAEIEQLNRLNDYAAQARATAAQMKAQEADQKAAQEEAAKEAERKAQEARLAKRRRQATLNFTRRLLTCLALCAGVVLAQRAQLLDLRLALPVAGAALAWGSFWTGSWVQYMQHNGGLWNG